MLRRVADCGGQFYNIYDRLVLIRTSPQEAKVGVGEHLVLVVLLDPFLHLHHHGRGMLRTSHSLLRVLQTTLENLSLSGWHFVQKLRDVFGLILCF
jgi:hypothetical protein